MNFCFHFIVQLNNESVLNLTVAAVETRLMDSVGPVHMLLARMRCNGNKVSSDPKGVNEKRLW